MVSLSPIPVKHTQLSNGLSVVAASLQHLHTVAIIVRVRAGSRYETPETNGISHFVEHMLYRGNHVLGDTTSLHRAAARLGSTLDAYTHRESVEYDLLVTPERVHDALAFLGTLLTRPRLDDIELERLIVLDEMQMHRDKDGQPLSSGDRALQFFFSGHPLGLLPIGTPENVMKFDIEAVRKHFMTHYTGTNVVVGVVGPCDMDAVFVTAERHLGHLAPGRPLQLARYRPGLPWPCASHLPSHHASIDLFVMCKTTPRTIREELALCALQIALGSGLESLLHRELSQARALVYWADASLSLFSDTHLLEVMSVVQPDRLAVVLDRMLEIMGTVRHYGIDEDLLDMVKRRYRRNLLAGYDDCRWLASSFTTSALRGEPLADLEAEAAIMDGLTPDTVRDAARDIMTASNTAICSVGGLEDFPVERYLGRVMGWVAGGGQLRVVQDAPAR